MEVWFNPGCSKCRVSTELLDELGVDYTIRRYLDDPPNRAELQRVLDQLGVEPWDITRLQEPVAKELDLDAWPRERDRWIDVLVEHPILIQRPIILADDGRAVVGRDPETVREIARD
ncbi:MAG: arsenate reductase family protein [Mycobacteriales bacterium]|nr:arsenate reductase family protein [Frankia sp.]